MVEVAIALQKRRFGSAPGGRRGGAAGPLAVLDEVGEHSGDSANALGVALRNPGLRLALQLVEDERDAPGGAHSSGRRRR
jgi:hypothetical protein